MPPAGSGIQGMGIHRVCKQATGDCFSSDFTPEYSGRLQSSFLIRRPEGRRYDFINLKVDATIDELIISKCYDS